MARVVVIKIALPEFNVAELEEEMERRDQIADDLDLDLDMHEKHQIASLVGFDDDTVQLTGILYCQCGAEPPHPPALVGYPGILLDARFEDRPEVIYDSPDDNTDEDYI